MKNRRLAASDSSLPSLGYHKHAQNELVSEEGEANVRFRKEGTHQTRVRGRGLAGDVIKQRTPLPWLAGGTITRRIILLSRPECGFNLSPPLMLSGRFFYLYP